jgi:hypothetical protein
VCYQIVQALIEALTGEDFAGATLATALIGRAAALYRWPPVGVLAELCSPIEAYKYVFES